MDTPQPDEPPLSAPESSQTSLTRPTIAPTSYLTVPSTRPSGSSRLSPPEALLSEEEHTRPLFDYTLTPTQTSFPLGSPRIFVLPPSSTSASVATTGSLESNPDYWGHPSMSIYSTASTDSEYSNPPARVYQYPSFERMSGSRKITMVEKDQKIQALRSHRINTVVELRRVEKAFAILGSPDVTEPMTTAWSYYVNSHSLLTELRGLTRNYPFSSEVVEEAKRRVYSDPQSNRSWNFCWLVLVKIQNDQLIPYYAQYQASQPAMWGDANPTVDGITKLSGAFSTEWNWALSQMLKHWEQPPSR